MNIEKNKFRNIVELGRSEKPKKVDEKPDYAAEVLTALKKGDREAAFDAAAKRAVKIEQNPEKYKKYEDKEAGYIKNNEGLKEIRKKAAEAEEERRKKAAEKKDLEDRIAAAKEESDRLSRAVSPYSPGSYERSHEAAKKLKDLNDEWQRKYNTAEYYDNKAHQPGQEEARKIDIALGKSGYLTYHDDLKRSARFYAEHSLDSFKMSDGSIKTGREILNEINPELERVGAIVRDAYKRMDHYKNLTPEQNKMLKNMQLSAQMEQQKQEQIKKLTEKYGYDETFDTEDLIKWAKENGFMISPNNSMELFVTPKRYRGNGYIEPTEEQKEDAKALTVLAKQNAIKKDIENSKAAAVGYNIINSTAGAIGRGIAGAVGTVEDAVRTASGQGIDMSSKTKQGQYFNETIKNTTQEEYTSKWFGGKEVAGLGNLGNFVYNTATGLLENATIAATSMAMGNALGLEGAAAQSFTSGMTSALMGSDVAQRTIIDAKRNGRSDVNALLNGIASGTIEWLTEKYSVETILDEVFKKNTNIFKIGLKSFLAEGSEEIASNWLNRAVDNMLNPGTDDISRQYYTYIANGDGEKEALKKVMLGMFSDDFQAGLAGGISGIGMGGAFRGVNAFQDMRAGKYISNKGAVNSLISQALNMPQNTESFVTAQRLAQEITEGKEPSNKQVGELLRTFTEEGGKYKMPETEKNITSQNENVSNPTQNAPKNTGIVQNEASEKFRAVRPKYHKVLDGVGKRLGVSIVIDENIEGADGYFDPKTSELHISANAQSPLKEVMKHEITHVLEGTKEYDDLVSFMKETFAKEWSNAKNGVIGLYERINKSRELSGGELIDIEGKKENGDIDHETMAVLAEQFKSDEFLERVANENPSMVGKIKNFISDIIARFKGIFSSEEVKRWQEAEKKWEQAFMSADVTAREGEREYSFAGKTSAGIEVYETNDDIKKLSYKDRKKKYLNLLQQDYIGRTAKFVRNGHTYYAEFDRNSLNKPIYGESHNSEKGKKAIINVGASGDIFTLVENSEYDNSKRDTKGHKAKDGFTDYFDYFVKTVQIDNKVFDLNVTVKKQMYNDGGYTYTLFLTDNNKIKASPAVEKNISFKTQAKPLSNNNVSQNKPVVKTYNTQNFEKDAESDTKKEFKLQEPKGISEEDVKSIQSIGRKSVNEFTSGDIEKTEAFARQYYKEMGIKSPFFRAWFGDWRASDNSRVTISDINKNRKQQRGTVKNSDTNIDINVSKIGADHIRIHLHNSELSKQIVSHLDIITRDAILFDTNVSKKDSMIKHNNTLMMHSFYAPVEYNGKTVVLKLYVEEFFNSWNDKLTRRDYDLKQIEAINDADSFGENNSTPLYASKNASITSVSDLFKFVKTYDKDFKPKPTSLVLNDDGTPKVMYHGSKKGGGFTVFKDWQYFTENKKYAERYTERDNPDSLYNVYLKVEKPFDTRNKDAKRIFEQMRQEYGLGELQENGLPDWTDGYDIAQFIEDNDLDYDGIILDEGGDLVDGEPVSRGVSIVVRNSNQIKSATDNIGTFDGDNPDIRYKLQEPVDIDAEYGSYVAAVEAENAEIKELNESLKREIMSGRTLKTNPARVNELVSRIRKDYKSTVNLKETAGAVQEIWEKMVELTERKLSPEAFKKQYHKLFYDLTKIGRKIAENTTEVDRTMYDQYKSLRDLIRNTGVTISDSDASSIPDFNAFRRSNFGRMKITKNTTLGVDSFYQELNEMYPEFFPEDITHPADQLMKISDVLDFIRPKILTEAEQKSMYGIDYDDAGDAIAAEIIHTLSQSDAYDAQTTTEYLKKSFVKAYKDKYDQLKAGYNERVEQFREQKKEREDRERLLSLAKYYQNLKTTPENLEKIPDVVKELDTMGISIREQGTKDENGNVTRYGKLELKELRAKYRASLEKGGETNKYIEKKIERLDRKQIGDMDISDVRDLITTLLAVKTQIQNENKLIRDEKRREIYAASQKVIKEVHAVRDNKKAPKGTTYSSLMLSPQRMARRIVNYAKNSTLVELVDKLNEGNHKRMEFLRDTAVKFLPISQQKEKLEKVSGRKAEIKTYNIANHRISLTPGMRIALYLHSQCEDNMRHITQGGIVVPNAKLYNKGDLKNAFSESKGAVTVKLTKQDIDFITRDMTAFEKQIAETVNEWLNGDCKKALNETSLHLLGYEVARMNRYMPIKVSDNYTRSEPLIVDGTLEGQGMLKERQGAVNPIKLIDIIRVIDMQKEGVSKYYGLAIPLRNFKAVYNSTAVGMEDSVKAAIDSVWGTKYNDYIMEMLADLETGRQSDDGFSRMLRKYRGNYAQAVLSLNLPVTIKQAASYPTAAAVVGWKPLMEALTKPMTEADKENMNKYSPLIWYRSQGYSMQEIGDFVAGKDGLSKRFPMIMGTIQKVDVATTTKLWKAAEIYVEKQGQLEKGTDAFYKEVARVHNKIIEETQPNYEVMQRPGILRNPNEVAKSLAMFATQRFQNYNILADSLGELKAAEASGNKEWIAEAKKNAYNAVTSQIVSGVVLSAMNFAGAFILHRAGKWKDDDEDKFTWGSVGRGFVDDVISSFAGMFLGGSELYQGFKAVEGKEKWYDITLPTTDIINGVIEQAIEFTRIICDHDRRFHIKEYINPTTRFAESAFQALGLPVANAGKLVNMVYEYALDGLEKFGVEEYSARYWKMKITTPEREKAKYGKFLKTVGEKALSETDTEKRERLLSQWEYISEDMKRYMNEDYITEKQADAFRGYVRQAIIDGDYDKVNELNKDMIRFIGPKEADNIKKSAIKDASSGDSAKKWEEEFEKTKPEETYDGDFDKDGTRYITYDGEKHRLTVEQEINYLTKIDDYTGDLYDSIIGNNQDISEVLCGKEKHTSSTTKTEEERVYDYFYRQFEKGKITEAQMNTNYNKYLKGELEVPKLNAFIKSQELTYDQLTYSQRKEVIETEEKRIKKGEITQAEFESWKKDFEAGAVKVNKSLQLIDLYCEMDIDTQHKVLSKIKSAATEKAQADMRKDVLGE